MTLQVRIRDLEDTDGLKNLVERRIGFATDRFAGRIRELHVAVTDTNGPRGGVDKHCLIRGVLAGGKSVTVEEHGSNAITAVNRAVRRLSGSLGRVVVRSRRKRVSTGSPAEMLSPAEADATAELF